MRPTRVGGVDSQQPDPKPAQSAAELITAAATSVPAVGATADQVLSALCRLGFRRGDAAAAVRRISESEPGLGFEDLLRKTLPLLVPAAA